MSSIDTSGIDETKPADADLQTQDLRDNLAAIKTQLENAAADIDAKQASSANLGDIAGLTPSDGAFIVGSGGSYVSESGATARTSMGAQAQDNTLDSLSALGTAADKYAYTTGVDTWAEGDITVAGRALLDDADASAQRTTLGLGTAAVEDVGTAIGDAVQLENVGGSAGLPAVDGSQLTGVTVTATSSSSNVTITPSSDANVTLSSAQNAATVRTLATGSWASGHSLICDDADREFTLINNSGFTATVTTTDATPTTVDVPTGATYKIITLAGIGAKGYLVYDYLSVSTIKSNAANTAPVFEDNAGREMGQLCKAWVSFNGTGTVAEYDSFNVSSITDNGTGDYTVNFANNMANANYAIGGSAVRNATNNDLTMTLKLSGTYSTSAVDVVASTMSTPGLEDSPIVNVLVFAND